MPSKKKIKKIKKIKKVNMTDDENDFSIEEYNNIKLMEPAEFVEKTTELQNSIIKKIELSISKNMNILSNYVIFNIVHYTEFDKHKYHIFSNILDTIIKKYTNIGWFVLKKLKIIRKDNDEDLYSKLLSKNKTYYLCQNIEYQYLTLRLYTITFNYNPFDVKDGEDDEGIHYVKYPKPHYVISPHENRCVICTDDDKPLNILFSCGHRVICESCDKLEKINKCPLCNKIIKKKFKLESNANLTNSDL